MKKALLRCLRIVLVGCLAMVGVIAVLVGWIWWRAASASRASEDFMRDLIAETMGPDIAARCQKIEYHEPFRKLGPSDGQVRFLARFAVDAADFSEFWAKHPSVPLRESARWPGEEGDPETDPMMDWIHIQAWQFEKAFGTKGKAANPAYEGRSINFQRGFYDVGKPGVYVLVDDATSPTLRMYASFDAGMYFDGRKREKRY